MFHRLMVVAVVVGGSHAVAAQENTLLIPSDREASAQVARIVASAEAAGLPTNPIVAKVGYGVNVTRSKPRDLVTAARSVAERLEIARASLEPSPSKPEIEAGANALAEKATPDALKAVRRASGTRPVVEPLGLLTQLLASKVSVKRATEIVTDLIKRGATPEQLTALGNDVGTFGSGEAAVAAAEIRVRGLIAVLAARGGSATGALLAPLSDGLTIKSSSAGPPGTPTPPRRP
ncbi:MAG TPA: hypothetical protein VH539_14395 [Gemmatimonadaceae bacterium]|jgi:hypothetical protein